MSKNLRDFVEAVYSFDAVVRRTPDYAWGNATPCEGWTALDLLQHQCAVLNGVQAVASTGAMAAPTPPEDMGDPQAVWAATRDNLLATLDTEGVLAQEGPFWFKAPTVDDMLAIVTWDPVTHAWDLAQATGQDPHLRDGLVQACHDRIAPMSDMMVESKRTAAPVEVGDGASVLDKYLALVGRTS